MEMRTLRSLRHPVIRMMIGVLLFAQMAIAAYACPNLTMPVGAGTQSRVQAAVPADADRLEQSGPMMVSDASQGQQSADHTPSPAVAPALLTALYSVTLSTATPTAEAAYYAPGLLLQAAAPPHAIVHCCLRT